MLRSSYPSLTGAGQHQRVQQVRDLDRVRQRGIRRSYTPAYGAQGLTRKAGPLSKDVETALPKEDTEKLKGTVKLKDAHIGLDGAEQSLLNQLAKIKEKKANLVKQAENSEKNNLEKGKKERMARHEAKIVREKKIPVKKEPDQMSATPGRKARKAEETAEDLEYQERSE